MNGKCLRSSVSYWRFRAGKEHYKWLDHATNRNRANHGTSHAPPMKWKQKYPTCHLLRHCTQPARRNKTVYSVTVHTTNQKTVLTTILLHAKRKTKENGKMFCMFRTETQQNSVKSKMCHVEADITLLCVLIRGVRCNPYCFCRCCFLSFSPFIED